MAGESVAAQWASDALVWAVCVVAIGFLSASGVIRDPAFAMASGALWMAIRADRKRGEG